MTDEEIEAILSARHLYIDSVIGWVKFLLEANLSYLRDYDFPAYIAYLTSYQMFPTHFL